VPSDRALRIAVAVTALFGLGVAGWLSYEELIGELPNCPVGGGGCVTVALSDYSDVAGIPVPYIGIGGYVAILASTLLRGDTGRLAGAFLTLVGFGFSLYLTYLELFVIEAICQYCVASAVAMLILLGLTWTRLLRYAGAETGSVSAP
jgi:uncharacterized membrane protein